MTMGALAFSSGISVSKMLKFLYKFFYVMDKMLSGELSCMQTGLVLKGDNISQNGKPLKSGLKEKGASVAQWLKSGWRQNSFQL